MADDDRNMVDYLKLIADLLSEAASTGSQLESSPVAANQQDKWWSEENKRRVAGESPMPPIPTSTEPIEGEVAEPPVIASLQQHLRKLDQHQSERQVRAQPARRAETDPLQQADPQMQRRWFLQKRRTDPPQSRAGMSEIITEMREQLSQFQPHPSWQTQLTESQTKEYREEKAQLLRDLTETEEYKQSHGVQGEWSPRQHEMAINLEQLRTKQLNALQDRFARESQNPEYAQFLLNRERSAKSASPADLGSAEQMEAAAPVQPAGPQPQQQQPQQSVWQQAMNAMGLGGFGGAGATGGGGGGFGGGGAAGGGGGPGGFGGAGATGGGGNVSPLAILGSAATLGALAGHGLRSAGQTATGMSADKGTADVLNDVTGTAIGGAGGAVSGAMAGATIGSVVPGVGTAVGAAIGGLVGASGSLASLPKKILDWSEALVESRRDLAKWSGVLQRTYLEAQRREYAREIQSARATGSTTAVLSEVYQDTLDDLQDIKDDIHNVTAAVLIIATNYINWNVKVAKFLGKGGILGHLEGIGWGIEKLAELITGDKKTNVKEWADAWRNAKIPSSRVPRR